MGINIQVAKMILHENQYKPLYGKILLIGRQTVSIEADLLIKIFNTYGINIEISEETIDNFTRHSVSNEYITHNVDCIRDDVFFKAMSNQIDQIEYLDVSDYEGASIIADINQPIAEEYYGKYDFIFDGGVLDNLFNPAQGIINMSQMLAKGGRICHFNAVSAYPGAMSAMMPEYFYSYYAINKYEDVKVYITQTEKLGDRFMYKSKLWKYSPSFTRRADYDHMKAIKANGSSLLFAICMAEKGEESSNSNYPKNLHYIDSKEGDADWSRREEFYNQSKRPDYKEIFEDSSTDQVCEDLFLSDHYSFLESCF